MACLAVVGSNIKFTRQAITPATALKRCPEFGRASSRNSGSSLKSRSCGSARFWKTRENGFSPPRRNSTRGPVNDLVRELHHMLPARQAEDETGARVSESRVGGSTIYLDLSWTRVQYRDRARIALIGELQFLRRPIGGVQFSIKVEDPEVRVLQRGLNDTCAGGQPERCVVANGPKVAIHNGGALPGDAYAVAGIDDEPRPLLFHFVHRRGCGPQQQ